MPATLEDASRLLDALYATGQYPALQVCVRYQGRACAVDLDGFIDQGQDHLPAL